MFKTQRESQQRFSIRKYAFGATSILLGTFFAVSGQAYASEAASNVEVTPIKVTTNETPTPEVITKPIEASSLSFDDLVNTDTSSNINETAPVNNELENLGFVNRATETPTSTGAVTNDTTTTAAAESDDEVVTEKPMTIFSLDAGRKYFTPDELKSTVDKVAKLGYTDFHLLLGNNGLRFVLDDMSLDVNGQTYSSDAVKEAIKKGNQDYEYYKYYDGINGAVLTQTEMDDIVNYTKSKNMRFIPTINSPGHMNAIVTAIGELGVQNAAFTNNGKTSAGTIDLNNKQAVDITKALIDKYAKYFSDKSEIFNIGLDEYANDSTRPKLGFKILQENGDYDKFVTYANDLAAIVKKHGLKPMAFNDGIYHANVTDQGTFDKDIIVSYWTLGFPVEEAGEKAQYVVATPQLLHEKGHKIINTNDDWYYIIGKDNSNSGWYNLDQGKAGIGRTPYNKLQGANLGEIPVLGAMLAVWADEPANTYREELVVELAKAFVNKNAKVFKADYSKLEGLVKVLETLPDKKAEAQKILDSIDWTKARNKQTDVDAYVRDLQRVLEKDAPVELRDLRIFSLDAGRKYFDKETIKNIINDISALGFTDLHLLLGNDGLRFILDDTSITAGGKTYTSDQVKEAIKLGNTQYYDDPNGNFLTQAELTEILEHAKSKNIGVIPTINSPGHMTALINTMYNLGISNPEYYESYSRKLSKGTVDLANPEAVEFTKELVKKYIEYFKGKVEIFNIGLDEYANDATNARGFEFLQSDGLYDDFINYANDLARAVKEAGLKPMAFSDGIYYDNRTNYGEFDKDILLSYWTSGWWGYYPARASLLEGKGHKIINTNDKWYNIIGNNDSGNYNYVNSLKNIAETPYKQVPGNKLGEIDTIGSILAIWADNPSATFEYEKFLTMAKEFAKANAVQFPAQYKPLRSKVEEVKAKDFSLFTEESVAKLNEIIKNINWYKDASKQAEVDQLITQLDEAVKVLEYKKADYTKVDEVLAKKPADLTPFVVESVKVLENLLASIDRNKDIRSQAEVDAYAEKIQQAIEGLVVKPEVPTVEAKPEIPAEISVPKEAPTAEEKPEITIESKVPEVAPTVEAKPEIPVEISVPKEAPTAEEKPEITIESKVPEVAPTLEAKPEIVIKSEKGRGLVATENTRYPEWKLLELSASKPELSQDLVLAVENKETKPLENNLIKDEVPVENLKEKILEKKLERLEYLRKEGKDTQSNILPKTSASTTNDLDKLPVGLASALLAAGLLVRNKRKNN